MPLTDDELFNFDHGRLADFDATKARERLARDDGTYRAQLVAALWIEGWREHMESDCNELTASSPDWHDGFEYATRELAAHLRQGDLLPKGVLHDETDSGDL